MDTLYFLLYQTHQTPLTDSVYRQAMDTLYLLLYLVHQTPLTDSVYSQAMDTLHFLLYQVHQSTTMSLLTTWWLIFGEYKKDI